VCRTYDIGDADGRPFLTMEYVDGEDLASRLRRIGRFPQERAAEVAREICGNRAGAFRTLPIFIAGVTLMVAVLLQFGLLSLVITFLTMYLTQVFPLTTDLSRPYAATSVVLMRGIAALSAYGFYASRGSEPLFGRILLD
jgi:hypothetical protein